MGRQKPNIISRMSHSQSMPATSSPTHPQGKCPKPHRGLVFHPLICRGSFAIPSCLQVLGISQLYSSPISSLVLLFFLEWFLFYLLLKSPLWSQFNCEALPLLPILQVKMTPPPLGRGSAVHQGVVGVGNRGAYKGIGIKSVG